MKITPLSEDEKATWPQDTVVKLEKPFIDGRGKIQPLVDMMMKSAVLITSNKGSLRANHYHKTDWHLIYVLEGSFEYFCRKTNSKDKIEKMIVKKDQLLFTGPMVDHAMFYPEKTVLLVVSKNPRDQKTYEEDTVRIDFVNDKTRF